MGKCAGLPIKNTPAHEAPQDLPATPKELIDLLVNGPASAEAIKETSTYSKKALVEPVLGAELEKLIEAANMVSTTNSRGPVLTILRRKQA